MFTPSARGTRRGDVTAQGLRLAVERPLRVLPLIFAIDRLGSPLACGVHATVPEGASRKRESKFLSTDPTSQE